MTVRDYLVNKFGLNQTDEDGKRFDFSEIPSAKITVSRKNVGFNSHPFDISANFQYPAFPHVVVGPILEKLAENGKGTLRFDNGYTFSYDGCRRKEEVDEFIADLRGYRTIRASTKVSRILEDAVNLRREMLDYAEKRLTEHGGGK